MYYLSMNANTKVNSNVKLPPNQTYHPLNLPGIWAHPLTLWASFALIPFLSFNIFRLKAPIGLKKSILYESRHKQTNKPCFVSFVHEFPDVLEGGDSQLWEVFDVRPEQRMFPNSKVPFVVRVQQVADPLAVDLHVTNLKEEKNMFFFEI